MNSKSNQIKSNVSRRRFLGMAVAGAMLSSLDIERSANASATSENKGRQPRKICIFSKHLQWLDYEGIETPQLAAA